MPQSICQQIWKTQQWPQDWKRSVFIPIPKGSAKECTNYYVIVLILHARNVAEAATSTLSAADRSYPTSEVRAEAGRTPCPKNGGQEELPHVQGQGQWPRVPGCNNAGTAKKSYPRPRPGVAARRSYPTPDARGYSLEDQPHAGSQGQRPGGPTPCPGSSGCAGVGGPRGAIPR